MEMAFDHSKYGLTDEQWKRAKSTSRASHLATGSVEDDESIAKRAQMYYGAGLDRVVTLQHLRMEATGKTLSEVCGEWSDVFVPAYLAGEPLRPLLEEHFAEELEEFERRLV